MSIVKLAVVGIVATLLLNVVWENAEAPLYGGYGGPLQHFWPCTIAATGDVLIVALLYAGVALRRWRTDWYLDRSLRGLILLVLLGGPAAVLLEWWALETDRWRYAAMPVVPIVGAGLAPVLQMMIIPPLVIRLLRLLARRGASRG
ncbi:MAG: hypothetical protein ABL996_16610 [Micropepsaceae bacterium]